LSKGGSLKDLVAALKSGTVKPSNIPPIRLFVPAGIYAKEYLQKKKLWGKIGRKNRADRKCSRRAVAVESGNAVTDRIKCSHLGSIQMQPP
jgi:hypothetical protein